jgi:hypothetical protein
VHREHGHLRYVEDSIFLSTVHAVGTASIFRQIWHDAYQQVRQFKERKQSQETGLQTGPTWRNSPTTWAIWSST